MLMTTAWSVIYVCSFSSANLSAKIFWENLMYIPIGFTPVLFLVLCLQFTGYDDWVYSKKIGWLILLPVIFFIIKWTDVRYGLIYYDMHIVQIGTHSIMAKQFGPVFYVDVAYTLLLTFTSIILLIRGLFFQNPVYRRQSVALLAAITLPHIPYIHFLITKDHIISAVISTTILSYGPAGLIMAWGIFRLKLFDLVPVARDTVIETMDAGVMVLDMRARIIDINPAFLRILQPSTDQVIGRKIEEVCSIPGLLTVCLDQTISEAEVLIEHAEHCREYQVLLAPVTDQHGQINGRLVISYDITEKKKARQYQLQQQARMAVIEEQARIARDLHDNLGQLLAFINLQAQGIRQELNNTGVVTAAGQLEKLIAVTQQAHHEVRECIQNTPQAGTHGKGLRIGFGAGTDDL
jgi:PAS domain S-box-containing protein